LEKRFPNLFLLDSIVETTKKQHPPSSSSTTSEERIADELDHWEDLYPDITAKVGVAIGQAADYMSQFRADNIVRDAELLKEVLFLNPKDSDKVHILYDSTPKIRTSSWYIDSLLVCLFTIM